MAARSIDDFIDEYLRRYEQSRKIACREAILRDKNRVEEFIHRRGIFPETLFQGKLGFGESVAGVEKASLTDVQVAAVGDLQNGAREGRVQVSIDATVEVQIKISRISWPPIRKFRVGGEAQESGASRDVSAILGGVAGTGRRESDRTS